MAFQDSKVLYNMYYTNSGYIPRLCLSLQRDNKAICRVLSSFRVTIWFVKALKSHDDPIVMVETTQVRILVNRQIIFAQNFTSDRIGKYLYLSSGTKMFQLKNGQLDKSCIFLKRTEEQSYFCKCPRAWVY